MSATLLAALLAYWAPNHTVFNVRVWALGKPFGDNGFTRGADTVKSMDAYVSRVWLTNGDTTPLWGVPFKPSPVLPGTDKPTDAPSAQKVVAEWNRMGGMWEDGFQDLAEGTKWGGRRAVNHFHDPLQTSRGGGYTGITNKDIATGLPYVDLFRPGISASQWVQGASSGGATNQWGYPAALDSLHRAFTDPDSKMRQSGLACMVRAIGQFEHLVEDNTVPDHTRDLPHPGDGWEEYVAAHSAALLQGSDPATWISLPLTAIESDGLRGFWDRDRYSGDNPQITRASEPVGISEFVNANFFAWNILTKAAGATLPIPKVFTTIPDAPGEGFVRYTSLPQIFTGNPWNYASYNWPQLGPEVGGYYNPTFDTLQISPIARKTDKKPILDDRVWAQYAPQLIPRAFGYAQTVLALAFPPARAELASTGNVSEVVLRLWNLSAGTNAVTWVGDAASIVSMRPDGVSTAPWGDDSEVKLPSAAFTLPPGGFWESSPFTLTPAQQFSFTHANHTVVLIKAHIGTANTTPIALAVPIPNLYPVVEQQTTVDLALPSTNNPTGCSSSCTDTENARIRVSFHQQVTGVIRRVPTELDVFGRPAEDLVKRGDAADARIAGVALVAYPQLNADFTKPLRPTNSTLTLTGGQLKNLGGGVWTRPSFAVDKPDDDISFVADLFPADFYLPISDDFADATRASATIYIVVWTTSGAFHLQKLILWPMTSSKLASTVLTGKECDLDSARTFLSSDESAGCRDGGNQCQDDFTRWTRADVLGEAGLHRELATDTFQIIRFAQYGTLVPQNLAGFTVPVDANGIAQACPSDLTLFFGQQSVAGRACGGFLPGLIAFQATHQTGAGSCGSLPPRPDLPRTQTFTRPFNTEKYLIQTVLGHPSMPASYTLILSGG